MSIVSLPDPSRSRIKLDDLHHIASQLGVRVEDNQEADDYLLLLRSLEEIVDRIAESPDYIPPELTPLPVKGGVRAYTRPDTEDNPMNAWSHKCHLEALEPKSKLLAGRTIVIKDNICVGGLPTTIGTFPSITSTNDEHPISSIDAPIVSRLLTAGAIIKGTSTCENYCMSPLAYTSATGPVHNPLLHGYTTGGSSSGSAALVAAHIIDQKRGDGQQPLGETVEMAIGGDQAGSIRMPAAFNGLYGLKPTFGLVPYTAATGLSPMIDHLGPIASSLEDVALILKAIAGYDGLDPRMTPESPLVEQVKDYPALLETYRKNDTRESNNTSMPKLRVGLLTEGFALTGVSAEVRDTILRNAKDYFTNAGATVQDISIPMHNMAPLIWTAATRLSMSQFCAQGKPGGHLTALAPHIKTKWPPNQQMYEDLTTLNPAVINVMFSGEYARLHFDTSYEAKAHRKVFELRAAYDKAFEDVDVLITPTTPTVAMPHPRLRDEDGKRTSVMEKMRFGVGLTNNTCPFNITGHPAMNVPCGYGSVDEHPEVKLPVGMQIIGRRFKDEEVLRAAALFEAGRTAVKR